MTEQGNIIKRLDKDSQLEGLGQGDVVEIFKIASPEQNEKGRVWYTKTLRSINGRKVGVVFVAIRSLDAVDEKMYLDSVDGITEHLTSRYLLGSQKYNHFDQYLQEADL